MRKLDVHIRHAYEWLDDEAKTSAWIKRPELDLRQRLKDGNGIAKIHDFLPEEVADGVRAILEGIPEEQWERAGEGNRDDAGYTDRVQHGFCIVDIEPHEILLGVGRLLARLLPGTLPNFSAARYKCTDHIAPHDDLVPETYTEREVQRVASTYGILVNGHGQHVPPRTDLQAASKAWREDDSANSSLEQALESGDLEAVRKAVAAGGRATSVCDDIPIPFSRKIAVAYYLTRDWKEDYGGQFVDLQDKHHHVPDFNTLVAFEVPRMHEVTAVSGPKGCGRHSIFGWWLSSAASVPRALRTRKKRPSGVALGNVGKRPAGVRTK